MPVRYRCIITEGSDIDTIHKVCANPDCPIHHARKQQPATDAAFKAEQEKRRREEAIAQATGLRVLKATSDAVPVRLMKRDLLFVTERLAAVLDERRQAIIFRLHGVGEANGSGEATGNPGSALTDFQSVSFFASYTLVEAMKIRLDKVLVARGLAASRERANALILAGRVLVAEQRVDKPGTAINDGAEIRLLGDDLRYVSRGGLKLEGAIEHWKIALSGRSCIDVGASTGGFTDCMLQHGAASVLAVDTGYGQIAHKLRVDPRVSLRERCNARLLSAGELLHHASTQPEVAEARISFLAMDVSFISATLVLPAVLRALVLADERWQGEAVILIKPQFEAGREHVGKGGIVRTPEAREIAIQRVKQCIAEMHGTEIEIIDSPIHGMEGNHEYLLHTRFV